MQTKKREFAAVSKIKNKKVVQSEEQVKQTGEPQAPTESHLKPVATVTYSTCPHCKSSGEYIKLSGHHAEVKSVGLGTVTQFFRAKCKKCGGRICLREVKPLT